MSFEDDDDNGAGSPDTSSENDVDETMEEVDADMDADGDNDDDDGDDGEDDNDDDEGDNDDDEDQDQDQDQEDEMDGPSQSQNNPPVTPVRSSLPNGISLSSHQGTARSYPNPAVTLTTPSPNDLTNLRSNLPFRPVVRKEALEAQTYDIVPTIAAPHSTSINAITATPDMRWVFSGGADGYIRKFNWVDTANGKLMLTVAQRHPFVDSVTKAGVLLSYWENEEPSDRGSTDDSISLSPVYSLAVQHEGLWLLSGLESGGINLQSVRHEEGKRITCLRQHNSAVSVLTLAQDEKSVLSGSWDKMINDWDLNTGQVKRRYEGNASQICTIELRPLSTLPVPEESGIRVTTNGTFSSNNSSRPRLNGVTLNGNQSTGRPSPSKQLENGTEDAQGSPDDSLFGGSGDKDSLFGDDQQDAPSGAAGGLVDDDDDEFSRAIASTLQQQEEEDGQGDLDMMDVGGPVQPLQPLGDPEISNENFSTDVEQMLNGDNLTQQSEPVNGLPHSEEIPTTVGAVNGSVSQDDSTPSSETTFLDASVDGMLRVWDRRQPNPVARMVPSRSIPPWCMNACWSPDGNFIYAGRRNGTVDEYSLHKGLREPQRTFKFPSVSGHVSAVRVMPNGRHLVCASHDILRLYDLKDHENTRQSTVPYLIIPGHRTGTISQLYIDPTCTFMISAGGTRGWDSQPTTEVLLGYEIGIGA